MTVKATRPELQIASEMADVETVLRLLDSGCDIEEVHPQNGETALLQAIEHTRPEIVRLLLERGANPNHAGAEGETPLQRAIDTSVEDAKCLYDTTGQYNEPSTEIVLLLMTSGANPYQADHTGRTAFDRARRTRHVEAERILETYSKGNGS